MTLSGGESRVLFRSAQVSKAVFSSSPELLPNSLEKHHEDVISVLDPVVFETMNIHLQSPVTNSEILKATKQLGGLKASGDDGFPDMFYQKYWNFLGVSVCQAVRYFFEMGNMLPELNKTLVVLIPKTPAPQTITHFWPISLCNFIYKIISKVLSNRLKPLMRTIISPQQSAFILGREIQDSIVVANEAFHYIQTKSAVNKMLWL
nr:reverse transcriptase [Tanacetum cinerariifolium]